MILYLLCAMLMLIIVVLLYRLHQHQKMISHFERIIDQHVLEVETMYSQMRGIRHDYKNQLQVLKTHLFNHHYGELQDYLNQLEHELNTVDTIVYTGNVAIDAVINSKLTLARNNGVQLSATAIIPSTLSMSHLDMGILIGNLLSNAYESAIKCQQPFIRLYIAPIKGNLYINCTNSSLGKVKSLITTKQSVNHGFGIKRMNQIVHKYQGEIFRASEEGVFSTEINLPLMLES